MYKVQTGDRTLKSLTRQRSRCRLSRGSLIVAIFAGTIGAFAASAAPSGASVITWSGQLAIQSSPPPLVSKAVAAEQHANPLLSPNGLFYILPSQLPVDLAPEAPFRFLSYRRRPPDPEHLGARDSDRQLLLVLEPRGDLTVPLRCDGRLQRSDPRGHLHYRHIRHKTALHRRCSGTQYQFKSLGPGLRPWGHCRAGECLDHPHVNS